MVAIKQKKVGASDHAPTPNESLNCTDTEIIAQKSRPLTPKRQALSGRYWPLAQKIARCFAAKYPQFDIDWEGAAALGIVKAAQTWRRGGARFRNHMHSHVHGACIDAMRAGRIRGFGRSREYKGAPVIWPLDEALGIFGDQRTYLPSICADDDPVGWEIEAEDEVVGLTRPLRRRNREVFRRLYLRADQATLKVCGRALGYCESRASQLHSEGLAILREALAARGGAA